MPAPRYRTRGRRKRHIRTPGGRAAVHYKKKKTGPARCAWCGRPLSGVPSLRPSLLRTLPRSSRRPNRPFGGNLCPVCSRRALRETARGEAKWSWSP